MSEAENEEQGNEEPGFVAPDGADEPNPDDEDNGEQEPEPAQEPEPEPEQGGMSEKQLEAAHKKIERAATNFRNRVSEVMGEDAQSLVECPVCAYFIPGMIFPQEFTDDQKVALWPYMGLPDPNTVPMASWAAPCEACDGWGKVRTPSKVATQSEKTCIACGGAGFLDTSGAGNGQRGTAPSLDLQYQAAPDLVEDDDPAVATLKALGYTVIPPFRAASGV